MCVFLHTHACRMQLIMGAMSLWTWPPGPVPVHKAQKKSLLLREALHVQDVEGMRQACFGAHVDAGTLSPAIHTLIGTERASGRRATRKRSTCISKPAPTAIHRLRHRERPAGSAMTPPRDSAEHRNNTPKTPPERRGTCKFASAAGTRPLAS